jgi:hypothetical protein
MTAARRGESPERCSKGVVTSSAVLGGRMIASGLVARAGGGIGGI